MSYQTFSMNLNNREDPLQRTLEKLFNEAPTDYKLVITLGIDKYDSQNDPSSDFIQLLRDKEINFELTSASKRGEFYVINLRAGSHDAAKIMSLPSQMTLNNREISVRTYTPNLCKISIKGLTKSILDNKQSVKELIEAIEPTSPLWESRPALPAHLGGQPSSTLILVYSTTPKLLNNKHKNIYQVGHNKVTFLISPRFPRLTAPMPDGPITWADKVKFGTIKKSQQANPEKPITQQSNMRNLFHIPPKTKTNNLPPLRSLIKKPDLNRIIEPASTPANKNKKRKTRANSSPSKMSTDKPNSLTTNENTIQNEPMTDEQPTISFDPNRMETEIYIN